MTSLKLPSCVSLWDVKSLEVPKRVGSLFSNYSPLAEFFNYSAVQLTQFSLGILSLNRAPCVTECVPISVSPVAYCCTLKATRFARWMHLWPPIDGMKSGRRQGASTAPLPVPYPGPVSGKEGRARVLWSRASSIEYPIETVSSRGRIRYYYILAIDFIETAELTWSEHSAPLQKLTRRIEFANKILISTRQLPSLPPFVSIRKSRDDECASCDLCILQIAGN